MLLLACESGKRRVRIILFAIRICSSDCVYAPEINVTITAATAAAALTSAAATTWYVNGGPAAAAASPLPSARPPPPSPADTVLGHASKCACQLVAFTAFLYALSACGVVRLASRRRGRCDERLTAADAPLPQLPYRCCCRCSDGDAPLSEPAATFAANDSDSTSTTDRRCFQHRHKYRHRKFLSAAPVLQR